MKKSILLTGLLVLTLGFGLQAQTTKKPAAKSNTQKPSPKASSVSRQEAINKAREDSILAVYALAKQIAQQMIREDSIKKAEEAIALVQQKEMQKQAAKSSGRSRLAPKPKVIKEKTTVNAPAPGGFWIGLKGGINLAKWVFEPADDAYGSIKALKGASAGLILKIPFNDFLGLQIEPGFSQRGVANTIENVNAGSSDLEVNELKLISNYLEMPLLIQFTPRLGPLEGILAVGPELRYQIGPMKVKYTTKYYIDEELDYQESGETNQYPGNTFKKFDYGAVGVIGIAFPLSKLKIFADGRYHYGLGNFYSEFGSDSKINNRGLSFNAGILYRLSN